MTVSAVKIFDASDYEQEIRNAADLIKSGGIAVLPTETLYGAAASLLKADALSRLRQLPPAMPAGPLVVHLARPDDAMRFLGHVSETGTRMIRKLWPGPVAIVFSVDQKRQAEVAAEYGAQPSDLYRDGNIILRCPDHIVATDILARVASPVVLRKAGGSDDTAHRAEQAVQAWGDMVDLVIDAGPTKFSRPSTIVKAKDNGYEIIRAGVYDQRIIERLMRTTILFVCSGNTCRSPMAEAIARKILARKLNVAETELEKKGLSVQSAGSFAMPGAKATPAAVDALKGLGADLSQHRSRPLTVELIHQADLIYTMSRSHSGAVTALVPSASGKVTTLNPAGDIDDPIGGDVRLYEALAGRLHELIEKRLEEQPLP